MSYPLYHASREFVSVTLREDEWISVRGADEQIRGESVLEKYSRRLGSRDLSLFNVMRGFSYRNKKWNMRPAGKEAIVRVNPTLYLGESPAQDELYYHQQVLPRIP